MSEQNQYEREEGFQRAIRHHWYAGLPQDKKEEIAGPQIKEAFESLPRHERVDARHKYQSQCEQQWGTTDDYA